MTISDADVERHLVAQYEGVFRPGEVVDYFDDYVALDAVAPLVDLVVERCGPEATVLDVGCGYGAFVTAARERGLNARGIDTAEFEIAYARQRLEARGAGAGDAVFTLGDGQGLPYGDASFDGLTLWNVIEHVPDTRRLLSEAERVLRAGGRLFAIAPNYAAFRREAHYHVPWSPNLPRRVAIRYLAAIGRDPSFFETSIFPCTNWGVIKQLRQAGLEPTDARSERLSDPSAITNGAVRTVVERLRKIGLGGLPPAVARALLANPLRSSIDLEARKPTGR